MNLEIPEFAGVNEFNCNTEFIPFNFCKSAKSKEGKSVHFYLDDYQFERLWNAPESYIGILSGYDYVCQPDFSLYCCMPLAVQIYNHYRKQWLARFYEEHGTHIIPTICWSDERSFDFCFDGVPRGGVVTVSSVGIGKSKIQKDLFLNGYDRMMKIIKPHTVIFYGNIFSEIDRNAVDLIAIEPYYRKIEKRRKDVH